MGNRVVRKRAVDALADEPHRLREKLTRVLDHRQEVPARLLDEQQLLLGREPGKALREVVSQGVVHRVGEMQRVDRALALEVDERWVCIALPARLRELTPFALPVGDRDQERPPTALSLIPERPHELERLGVGPLRVVEPEHGRHGALPVEQQAHAVEDLVDLALDLVAFDTVEALRSREAVRRHVLHRLRDLSQEAEEWNPDRVRRRAHALVAEDLAHAARRFSPRGAVRLQNLRMRRDRRTDLGQHRAPFRDIADIGGLPACAEPCEPWRSRGDMSAHVGHGAELGANLAERVGPIVHLGWVPLRIVRQAKVELLHQAALADAALGDDERHAGAGELAVRAARGDRVEVGAEPRELLCAAVEAVVLRTGGVVRGHADRSPLRDSFRLTARV